MLLNEPAECAAVLCCRLGCSHNVPPMSLKKPGQIAPLESNDGSDLGGADSATGMVPPRLEETCSALPACWGARSR